jgi:hypothetical protein
VNRSAGAFVSSREGITTSAEPRTRSQAPMKPTHLVTAALSLLSVSAIVATAPPAPATSHQGTLVAAEPAATATLASARTPSPVQVPDGNAVVAVFHAEGVQTYRCGADHALTQLEPAAVLSDRRGRPWALHTRGPTWVSIDDGSAVSGTPVASAPVPGAVPELLLRATAHRGQGIFGRVSYVQRLRTHGGVAPSGPCTPGSQVSVPYSAVYAFYTPGPATADASAEAFVGA